MNITVNSTRLAQELRFLNKIILSNPTIPILANVLLRAADQLYLTSTNLEVFLSTVCPATVATAGEVTLPARRLLEMVEQFPNQDVQIVLDKNRVRIISAAFKSHLQTYPADTFPAIPVMEGEVSPLAGAALKRMIEGVTFAISEKAAKYVIDGALLSLNGAAMAMIATDGKRLSVTSASRADGITTSAIIPSSTLDPLMAQCEGREVLFSQTERHLFFATGARLLVSRMIDSKFPAYHRIIPQNCDREITVDRVGLAAALRRVGVVSDEHQAVNLTFAPGLLTLTSQSAGIGEAHEELPVQFDGAPLDVCINGKFTLDFLDHAVERYITIAAKGEPTALLFTDGSDFINVILLMRP